MKPALHKPTAEPSVADSRRERQKANRRRRIYEAAIELFAQKGFDETTVQEITDRADVGKGTFFNYFPSKEAILMEYYRAITDELIAHAEAAQCKTAREHFAVIFERAGYQARREGLLFEILIKKIFAHPELMQLDLQIYERLLGLFGKVVHEAQQRGELRSDLDVVMLARMVANIFSATALEWAFYDRNFQMSEMLLRKLDILYEGIGGPRGKKQKS